MQVNMSLIPEFEDLYNSYLTYPKVKLLEIDGIAPKNLDVGIQSHEFFTRKLADISTDGNSNYVENMNPTVYRTHTSNGQMKLLGYHLLWHYAMERYGKEFADEAISMIWDGAIYFHDAHGLRIQMPYCYAFSLDKIVLEGRPYGSSPNTPPKSRKSFLSQVDKLISDLSKQFAGATAPSDLLLWYSYFCKLEGIDLQTEDGRNAVIQDMQGLVCLFNEPGRAEGEPPFTNLAMYDMIGLENLFGHIVFPDWTKPDLEYIMELQKIFCEWFSNGDPITGFPYRFPVVTLNMTTDEYGNFADDETARWMAHVNRKMANFNLHYGDKSKIAMCCRYENDLDDMSLTPDSFGNGGVNIGSHRVITPNFARAALLSGGDYDKFISICDHYIDVAGKLLNIHRRDILEKRINKSPEYLQFFGKLGWFSLDTMFSTIGITGIHEMCEFMGHDITDDDGTEFVLDFMYYLKQKIKGLRKQYNCTFNMEEIPGEQACVTLWNKDKLMINPDMVSEIAKSSESYNNAHLYSNQYIPLTHKADIVTRLDLSGRFMKMISGGGIVHVNSEAPIDTDGKMYEIMKFGAKSGVSHMAICYRYGKCDEHKASIVGQETR
ncbi:MAG: anaerobic ribonucleoside-triphosphate reductase, partial [Bacteroidales bacterium]|nr:anaerobic ribonucleoside-triphosphate reductase [Bacteroidales bacterium]